MKSLSRHKHRSIIDAKMSGVVVEIPGHEHHVFHVDLKAVLVISVGEPTDHLVIETWSEGRGLQSIKRH